MFYFITVYFSNFRGGKNRGSMDPVHDRGSVDPVHRGGSRSRGACFVLSHSCMQMAVEKPDKRLHLWILRRVECQCI